jgi:hypothetical protein
MLRVVPRDEGKRAVRAAIRDQTPSRPATFG